MLILTTLPGSGKLGGVVGSRTRQGQRFHARTAHQQPMSPSQRNSGAITLTLARAWRSLTASQREAWQLLAGQSSYGYNAFIACNRRLATIGLPPTLLAPGARPSFPAIINLEANAIYSSGEPGSFLTNWRIDTILEQTGLYGIVVRATQALSQAKANIRPSDLRVIFAGINTTTPLFIDISAWLAVWGAGPSVGWVTFQVNLVDPQTGLAGTPASCRIYINAAPGGGPGSNTVIIEQQGVEIAVTTGIIYEQGGFPLT